MSELKWLNIAVLIGDNTSSDLIEEWYNEAVVEAEKIKKVLELDTPDKITYPNWYKWDKSVENYLSTKFNLRGVPLSYDIGRD